MRLFVAVELDELARGFLGEYQRQMGGVGGAVRWVRVEQIHLTVKFLGEVPDSQVMAVTKVTDGLAGMSAFDFEIGGVGVFGSPGAPRVIWAGVTMPNEGLSALQGACEKGFMALGFPPEGRRFSPHLTLGRVKDFRAGREVARAVEEVQRQSSERLMQRAEEVTLFESVLGPGGPRYAAVRKIALKKE